MSSKRKYYLNWEEYFMLSALLAGKRSKDPNTQVGAYIVDMQNRVIGVGYNGFPNNCSDDEFPWKKTGPLVEQKFMYVVHAEVNAILNKNVVNMNDSKIYVSLFPCNECAKLIIQSGIKEIIYLSDKNADKSSTIASKRMFDAVGIKYRQFLTSKQNFTIEFNTDTDSENVNENDAQNNKINKIIFLYPIIYLAKIVILKYIFNKLN